jgi:hypothetical protein
MPFIGREPQAGQYAKLDAITTSATATYNLLLDGVAYYPQSANHLMVSLNGVMQAPQDSFTIVNDTIVFDSALTSSDSIDFIVALGDVLDIGKPSSGTVTGSSFAAGTAAGGYFKGNNGDRGSTFSGKDDIFRVNNATLSQSVTIATTDNASAAGPLTIGSGVNLTVNGNLTIV